MKLNGSEDIAQMTRTKNFFSRHLVIRSSLIIIVVSLIWLILGLFDNYQYMTISRLLWRISPSGVNLAGPFTLETLWLYLIPHPFYLSIPLVFFLYCTIIFALILIFVPWIPFIYFLKCLWLGSIPFIDTQLRKTQKGHKEWKILISLLGIALSVEIIINFIFVSFLLPFSAATSIYYIPGIVVSQCGTSWYVLFPGWVIFSLNLFKHNQSRKTRVFWLLILSFWLIWLAIAPPVYLLVVE